MSYFFLYHPSSVSWLPAPVRQDYRAKQYLEEEAARELAAELEKKRKIRKRQRDEEEILITLTRII